MKFIEYPSKIMHWKQKNYETLIDVVAIQKPNTSFLTKFTIALLFEV